MPATGFIQLRAYTSTAQFPLKDVAITVTAQIKELSNIRRFAKWERELELT